MNPLLSFPEYLHQVYAVRIALGRLVGMQNTAFCVRDHGFREWASVQVTSPDGTRSVIPVAPTPASATTAHRAWQEFIHASTDPHHWEELLERTFVYDAAQHWTFITTVVQHGHVRLPMCMFGPLPIGLA